MEKPAPPNRNVVARRVAVRPRVEARTTEIDTRRIAELLDAQAATPKAIEPDLEAEIEIATSSSDASSTRTSSRLAHTLRRNTPDLARGSQPIVMASAASPEQPADPILPELVPDLVLAKPAPSVTTPMPVLMASQLASETTLDEPVTLIRSMPELMASQLTSDSTLEPVILARSRMWWVLAAAALLISGLALFSALRA